MKQTKRARRVSTQNTFELEHKTNQTKRSHTGSSETHQTQRVWGIHVFAGRRHPSPQRQTGRQAGKQKENKSLNQALWTRVAETKQENKTKPPSSQNIKPAPAFKHVFKQPTRLTHLKQSKHNENVQNPAFQVIRPSVRPIRLIRQRRPFALLFHRCLCQSSG